MAVERGRQLTGLELYRPVIDGAGRILNKIRFRGENIMGDDGTTADVDVYTREDALADGDVDFTENPVNKVMRQIGNPRFKVSDLEELRMSLYNIYAPSRESRALYLVPKVAETILPSPNPRYKAVKQQRQGIQPELFRVGLKHDIPNQDELKMWYSDLTIQPNMVTGKDELRLTPNMATPEAEMSVEQAELCRRALLNTSPKLRRMIILHGNGLHVTVATLAGDSTQAEKSKIEEQIGELLPVLITFGGIEKYIGHRSSISLV